uniref:DDE Tnp4 domain-containing protein n=1 Tax=Brassica oleracea var. oleracea TaxID=109376 RepID=A0A0D3BS72_BRAOL
MDEEQRDMKAHKAYYQRVDFVSNSPQGIPQLCPCGSTKAHSRGSLTTTRYWRDTRLSWDDRKHRLYALGVENCPTAWKGQYTRGSGKPTIVLEAVASQDLWIWHAFFGPPGTLNDINVLDRSPVFDDILQGRAPRVQYVVNGHQYDLAYYLTDGIYPKWSTFIQSISNPQGPEVELFAKVQEATRKDVERAFGVLQARFAIVKNPAILWDKRQIGMVMRTCIILHNMIVENERNGYTQYDTSEFEEGESSRSSQVDMSYYPKLSNLLTMLDIRSRVCDPHIHR